MDADTRARVFDPFFTTKGPGEGTGLGLSTVYAIVQRAGGSIRITSEPGAGSQFEIHWPATSEELSDSRPDPGPVPRGQERVLVVDDDREVRALVCRMLEKLGYATEQAASGGDALALASERPFDLVLTDVVMPGMSGLALARQLSASEIGVPTLFMSGHLDHPALRLGNLPAGAQLLSKPFTLGGLGTKVRQALDAGSPG
jgi:CheY-like chemotaxis protein